VSYFDTDILHELIAKLHKQNANKDKRITELEEENGNLKKPIYLGDRIIFTANSIHKHNLEQQQRAISSLNSYLIKRANEIGECLPMYLVDHIKEFKGGASHETKSN
jgi:hypothetical protein